MKKNLRKNKKGFTLVEIIVVLLIIGILLAITIPSIMGYVGKAKDAQIQADARTGFLGAQTITAKLVANEKTGTDITDKITIDGVNEEAGTKIVDYIKCTLTAENALDECMISTEGTEKYVYFKAGAKGTAGNSEVYADEAAAKKVHASLF